MSFYKNWALSIWITTCKQMWFLEEEFSLGLSFFVYEDTTPTIMTAM